MSRLRARRIAPSPVLAAAVPFVFHGASAVPARRKRQVVVSAIVAFALAAAPAAAQHDVPDTGGRVYALVGGGFGDGTFVATGAGAGLRLTRHVGLDLELTHLSGRGGAEATASWLGDLSPFSAVSTGSAPESHPSVAPVDPLFPLSVFEERARDLTLFLTKFTVEFPIADGRLFPYLTGGGGVGRVTERFGVAVDPFPWIPLDNRSTGQTAGAADADGAIHFSATSIFPRPGRSELGLGLALGGGVDVRLWRGLAAGVDIRWLRVLLDYDSLETAQVTGRVSYRF